MKTDYMLEQEVQLILRLLTPQNRLIMRVALATGLRISDVLELRPWQIKSHFWVTEKKTGKRRQVGLPEPLLSDVKKRMGREWVFPGRKPGKHKTRQAVWKDVKRAADAYRLEQNIAPHSARKVYAVQLLEKYGDINRVKRALNHSGLAVTMVYAMADKELEAKQRERNRRRNREQVRRLMYGKPLK